VLKKIYNKDLVDKYYLKKDYPNCDIFKQGQEFIYGEDEIISKPKDFCGWAWDDIQKVIYDVMITKKKNNVIVSCTDGVRPVIFRVERLKT
jgi:uncharacterized repeat protein (TIGR04076 family)